MKRPKAPPRAKPMPPAMMDLARQDSMPACICGLVSLPCYVSACECESYHLDRLLLVVADAGVDTGAAHARNAWERHDV
jgi:hypothetical protein